MHAYVCVLCVHVRERERNELINECKKDTKVYFESESLQKLTLYDVFEGVFFMGRKRVRELIPSNLNNLLWNSRFCCGQ